MKVLVTSPLFPPARLGGGPIRSIEAMIKSADERHEIMVLANNHDMGNSEQLVPPGNRWEPYERARVMYLNPGLRSWVKGLRTSFTVEPDAFYLNGLFNARFSIAMQVATQRSPKASLSIAPRGELNEGALNIKSRKKSLFLKSVNASGLLKRVVWHASSELEADEVRQAFGDESRVIVRENDTMLPRHAATQPERQAGHLRAVFMSRLSPKKGLSIALEALAHVQQPMSFDVIGPEEDQRYVQECRRIAMLAPSNITVRFLGPVSPDEIRGALAGYDLMVLPTAGENFGHVIGEALSMSLPVMLTDTTPWSSRIADGGGVLMKSRDAHQWGTALNSYASASPDVWAGRRREAGAVYGIWKSETELPHFFDQLESAIHS